MCCLPLSVYSTLFNLWTLLNQMSDSCLFNISSVLKTATPYWCWLCSLSGAWSQSSISRSLQRAETLLRSTFNPSLKWLFHGHSQDQEEEGNFVVAHNLVSRSSAHLLRLQQALLTVAPQWQSVSMAHMGSPQVGFRDCREDFFKWGKPPWLK